METVQSRGLCGVSTLAALSVPMFLSPTLEGVSPIRVDFNLLYAAEVDILHTYGSFADYGR